MLYKNFVASGNIEAAENMLNHIKTCEKFKEHAEAQALLKNLDTPSDPKPKNSKGRKA